MRALYALGLALGTFLVPAILVPSLAPAETISAALAKAYRGNPGLNSSRAATRVADEAVSKAIAGYRPTVVGTGSVTYANSVVSRSSRTTAQAATTLSAVGAATGATTSGATGTATGATTGGATGATTGASLQNPVVTTTGLQQNGISVPRIGAVTVTETVFNGNRTTNGVRVAESQDLGSREALRESEQETLLAGATAYMDVLRDTALEELANNRIRVLRFELRGARARFNAKEITFTDVAQVATSLAQARAGFSNSEATLATSIATFGRVIGSTPTRLEAARPVDAISPATLSDAIDVALRNAPTVAEALHAVDAAATTVQVTEGQLYPTVSLVGEGELALSRGATQNHLTTLSTSTRVSVPIYDGGQTYAAVRQAKEQLAAARFQADSAREQVRAAVATAWGQLEAAKATIVSAKAAVQASEVALTDVRAEASMGQRTTYDVLLAIQALFSARATLVSAQSERVVASYGLAAATGRLSAINLGLAVTPYDPTIHYVEVKDKWFGLRTPDGR